MIYAFISGNLGKDAEVRAVGNDKVCSFSVASARKVKGEEVTTWVRCSIWGKRGESVSQYLTKGSKVAVAGELSTREHDGKTYVELRVQELDFMSKGGGRGRGETPTTNDPPEPSASSEAGSDNDPIPF